VPYAPAEARLDAFGDNFAANEWSWASEGSTAPKPSILVFADKMFKLSAKSNRNPPGDYLADM
jgi:hypothetical protein